MNHTDLLKRLLPPGAYDLDGPVIAAELAAEGNALDTAQAAAELILSEFDPRTTSQLLSDWERVLGLPDSCIGLQPTVDQRRASVVAKVNLRPSLARAFFISLAAALGFTITTTEFKRHSVMSPVNEPITGSIWLFVWRVNAPVSPSNEILECVINKYKPAHTYVQFAYS